MDGRRRLAEPVTDGVHARPAAGVTPGLRRARVRTRLDLNRARLGRYLRRWLGPVRSWRLPRGVGIASTMAFVLASIVLGTVRGGHLPVIADELRDWRDAAANALGFRIASIALAGQHQLSREEILAAAGVTSRSSLLFLDAGEARARLKSNSWIAEATVLKLYPGRLRVAVTEREAFALWQRDGKVAVIADDGAVVERYVAQRFAHLPLVVGAGAEVKAKEFLALLDNYPMVRAQLRAAVLVANRRWNIVLRNGINVRLPEIEVEQALATLVRFDRDKRLLTRDIAAVDLRLPDRVTVQLTDEAFAARQDTLSEKKAKKKGGAA